MLSRVAGHTIDVSLFNCSGFPKTMAPSLLAIDRAIGSDDIRAEGRDDRVVGGTAGRVRGVRDFVSVESRRAELAEDLRDRAFARTDSASEANCNHLKSLARRFAGPRLDIVEVAEEAAASQ